MRYVRYLAGLVAVVGLLVPTPAHADPEDYAVATINGTVTVTDDGCFVPDVKDRGEGDGHKVVFNEAALAGDFYHAAADNHYTGTVETDAADPIIACITEDLVVDPVPVLQHGIIYEGAFAGFNGDKCLQGVLEGGDFVTAGAAAAVKFQIRWDTYFDEACTQLKSSHGDKKMNCLGAIQVVPRDPITGEPDIVTGAIACNQYFPTNNVKGPNPKTTTTTTAP